MVDNMRHVLGTFVECALLIWLKQVYSPWQRNWLSVLNANLDWLQAAPLPQANNKSIKSSPMYRPLFETPVPETVQGFECVDRDKMSEYWPAGTKSAETVCRLLVVL